MKRSILLSLMFVGGILGVLGFTAAQWQDHEQVNAPLTAGTLDMELGDFPGDQFQSAVYTCVLPVVGGNDSVECVFTVKNSGSVDAEVWVQETSTTAGCAGGGEFCTASADLTPDNVFVDEEMNGANNGFWDVPWSNFEAALCQTVGPFQAGGGGGHRTSWGDAIAPPPIVNPFVLVPGGEIDFKYIFKLGGIAGETTPLPANTQGDSITMTFHFTMLEAGVGTTLGAAPCLLADAP